MAAATDPDDTSGVGASRLNRLARAKSPYLLQHAGNPVDWYEWGEEAFARARAEGKAIFLSIGYSTCHWCHVMARESFEDEDTAALLNRHFVAVKVDREERPDVDRVYMSFVQATTGSGGWPLSVWLTPDLKPFYGGTYFPPESRYGLHSFRTVLEQLADLWAKDRQRLEATGTAVMAQLQRASARRPVPAGTLEASVLDQGFEELRASFEPGYGGFGGAPKFPRPVTLNFLLRYHARTGAREALSMSLFTLRKMAEGGMHDHLGGGFHRYSVDGQWHVPHFEKMLYDQAQLACAYLDACQITQEPFFAEVARGTLTYVLRDLRGEQGQFHSAEDADSPLPGHPAEHAEGAFYLWQWDEVTAALGAESAAVFCAHFGVEPGGNVAHDPHGEFRRKNVLRVRQGLEETGRRCQRPVEEVQRVLEGATATLLAVRSGRPRPHLDDKALAGWNGLMVSALARAAQVLGDTAFLDAAVRAVAFCESHLYDPARRRLLRCYRGGEAAIDGYAEDYAFLIQGLLDLYETAFDPHYLAWAADLQATQNARFADDGGGFYSTAGDDPSILLRLRDDHDGAEPAANSVSALNLLRLSEVTGRREDRVLAGRTLGSVAGLLARQPSAMPQMLVALEFALAAPRQVVIAGRPGAEDTQAMLRAVHVGFVPNKVLLLADGGPAQAALASGLEFLRGLGRLEGKATAYLCENHACQLPTTDPEVLRSRLQAGAPGASGAGAGG